MNIISIIPARGGAVGIPHKNVKPFLGEPLIARTIRHSLACSQIAATFVSTDDKEIARVSVAAGADIIVRPRYLAGADAQSEDVLIHALDKIGGVIDGVVFLQCTSPIRRKDDISRAIRMFQSKGCDSVFSACELRQYLRFDGYKNWYPDMYPRNMRVEKQPAIIENGSIYVFDPVVFRKQKVRLCGFGRYFVQPWYCGLELDIPEDWELCELIASSKKLELA